MAQILAHSRFSEEHVMKDDDGHGAGDVVAHLFQVGGEMPVHGACYFSPGRCFLFRARDSLPAPQHQVVVLFGNFLLYICIFFLLKGAVK